MTSGLTTNADAAFRARRGRSRPRRARRRRERQAGLTLIEIMIVIVIIAAATTGISLALGAVTRSHLRSAATKVAAAAKYGYNRSVARGTTVRIVFDLDNEKIAIEEAEGDVYLTRTGDERRRDDAEEDSAGIDPWEEARAKLEERLSPVIGASPFGAITNDDGEAIARYAPQDVGDGIQIVRLITPHEPEPREQGKGSIYFFPGGRTEHAVVHLSDDGERIYSVEIHPLTGRAKVHTKAYEPPEISDDADEEDRSELRDDR